MQEDFHYYGTYCAAVIAGYTHSKAFDICYSAQLVDLCSRTFLGRIKAPLSAATTQLQLELMEARTDIIGLQDITRIWSSFHFLPRDLTAKPPKKCGKKYLSKYRLICGPNGELVKDTVDNAAGKSLQAYGVAMHVLADTWAHRNFAGTPSLVINNSDSHIFELLPDGTERKISFKHNPTLPDDPDEGRYISSAAQPAENSIMNLGHGRVGHLPDYSYARYRYYPAWGDYNEELKENPSDYYNAFTQMIFALKCLRQGDSFETLHYDTEAVEAWDARINEILNKRQTDASDDWKKFGEELSGEEIPKFDLDKYVGEYTAAKNEDKNRTFLGRFILAALSQKSMVTNKIFKSGNMLAGYSVDYDKKGFRGIRDFRWLLEKPEGR